MLPPYELDSFQKQLDDLKRDYSKLAPPGQPALSPSHQIQSCDGIRAAKAYQETLPPGSSDIVMDSNNDVFYVVMKDEKGKSPDLMTIGRFTLEKEEPPESIYITKKDFAAFEERIMKLLNKEETNE